MFEIIDNHVSVDVADLEATRRYLEESCGLNKLREVNRPGLTIAWYPGLELWQATDDAAPGIVKHVAWQVDDINAAVVDLKAKGVTFDTEEIQQIDVGRGRHRRDCALHIFYNAGRIARRTV